MENFLFYLLSPLLVMTSVVAVSCHGAVHSVICFIVTSLLFSCLLFELGLNFIGVAMMIVRANLGVVLFLLAITELGGRSDPGERSCSRETRSPARSLVWLLPAVSVSLLAPLCAGAPVVICDVDLRKIASFLFGRGVLLTEILSLILLVVATVVLNLGGNRSQGSCLEEQEGRRG